ncbi:MAG TPA: YlbF family regulator [Candidatus Limiplasma sp.]|nr:YlbF family regulator [Candidatus Limiplasma sp.]
MNNVNKQAELLGEAILASDQFIAMRLAEQAVMNDDKAQELIQLFSQRKDALQKEIAKKPMDEAAMAKAGEAVQEIEQAIGSHPLISAMREKSADYQDMMQQVNNVLARVINGEPEEGCSGCCEGCSGCH